MGKNFDLHIRDRPEPRNGYREQHGHDIVQDRQTAADYIESFPVQSRRRRFRNRSHIDAPLHGLHGTRLLAPGGSRLRHLARPRLPGEQCLRT